MSEDPLHNFVAPDTDCAVSEREASRLERKAPAHAAARAVRSNWTLIFIFVAVILSTIFANISDSFDNDMWWLLATGREIVDNGIPYTNPWADFQNLGIVVQQWLAAVILYGVWCMGGFMGVKVLVFLLCIALMLVLFGVCRVISNRRTGGAELFAFAMAVGYFAFTAYLSERPHVYSMMLYAVVVAVMERYRQTNNARWLILLPVITCLHVNLHAAMAPFDLFIIALYLLPDLPSILRASRINTHGLAFDAFSYRRAPLLVALVVAALALLVNPYGLKGACYLLLSYETAGYANYINEMGTTGFWTSYGGGAMACIVLGAIAIGRNGAKRFDPPLTILFLVCIPLSMLHVRNVWLVALFSVLLFARAFSDVTLNVRAAERFTSCRPVHLILIVLVMLILLARYVPQSWDDAVANAELDGQSTPSKALDYLDSYVAANGISKSSLKVYNSFNNGGYVEWRGYHVFMDARPELWEPGITGVDEHYYKDFVDNVKGVSANTAVLETCGFDVCIAYTGSDMATALSSNGDYQKVLTGQGYSLWARTELNMGSDPSDNSGTPAEITSTGTSLEV